MLTQFSLTGKTALITGGATGLGLAMSECLMKAGARVVIVSRSKKEKVQDALDKLGENAFYFEGDISKTETIPALVQKIHTEVGQIDFLINNAGNHCKKPIEEMKTEEFSSVLQTHLVGAFALTRALLPDMRARKNGAILFIASMTSFIGQPYVMGYSAAKSGILGMVHTLSAEVSCDGVRVNAIAPGWIDTPMFRAATDNDAARKEKILGRIQMKKVGKPSDIGWAAVYLCSEAAKYITGTCLPVDGGALIGF